MGIRNCGICRVPWHLSFLLDEVTQSWRKLFFVSNLSEIIEFSEEVKKLLTKRDVEQIMMV